MKRRIPRTVFFLIIITAAMISLMACANVIASLSTSTLFTGDSRALSNTPTPFPTFTPTPTPIVIVAPPPTLVPMVPYNLQATEAELASARFITTDTVAYLQWSNLYTYSLTSRTGALIAGNKDIGSFDWSTAHQKFVLVREGKLFLLDATGSVLTPFPSDWAKLSRPLEAPACDTGTPQKERANLKVNLLEQVKWVRWSPDGRQLLFFSDVDEEGDYCYSSVWLFTPTSQRLYEVGKIRHGFPQWLNSETILMDSYGGGGLHSYTIVDAQTGRRRLSLDTEASVPIISPASNYLADLSVPNVILRAWNIAEGRKILHWTLSTPGDLYRGGGWSSTGRYLVLGDGYVQMEGFPLISSPRLMIIDIVTKQTWELIDLVDRNFWAIWLPDTDELLLFTKQGGNTRMLLLNPERRLITELGDVPEVDLYPAKWSPTGRYLVISGANSLWLWDEQIKDLPFPLYQMVVPGGRATFGHHLWSSQTEWLLFVQFVGGDFASTVGANPYMTDITLQAFHLLTGEHQQITKWSVPE